MVAIHIIMCALMSNWQSTVDTAPVFVSATATECVSFSLNFQSRWHCLNYTHLFDRTRSRARERTHTHPLCETWCFMLEQYEVIIRRRHIPNANVTSTSTIRVSRNYYREKKIFFTSIQTCLRPGFSSTLTLIHTKLTHTLTPTKATRRKTECFTNECTRIIEGTTEIIQAKKEEENGKNRIHNS